MKKFFIAILIIDIIVMIILYFTSGLPVGSKQVGCSTGNELSFCLGSCTKLLQFDGKEKYFFTIKYSCSGM